MNANCGRIDDHAEHDWTRPRMLRWPAETYTCEGPPVTEGGYTHDADKADDAWEDSQDRERREVVA